MAFNLGDALKGVSAVNTGREQIEYIRLDRLDEDPNNFYLLSGIDELAVNIELCGLQQPIRVRPVPDSDRYMIVSGHRRRAAICALAQENPEKWNEIPCIVEQAAVSQSLQQLRLIYANAHTRKMTPAETSRQAEEVTNLLYQLKEEGYEFPGRMRDHVAEAVGVSKTKLARLKVIRENLDASWVDAWENGTLTEAQAYALAKMPPFWQSIIKDNWERPVPALYADTIDRMHDKFNRVNDIKCSYGLQICEHTSSMMARLSKENWYTPCTGCCFDCSDLRTCKNCCPQALEKQKELKAANKAERQEERKHQEDLDRPGAEFAKMVYQRIGEARSQNDVSVETLTKARGTFYSASIDLPKQLSMESGDGKYSPNTYLPLGTSVRACDLMQVVAVADALQCSVDYLLGRTEEMGVVSKADTISQSEKVSAADTAEKEKEFIPGSWYPVSVEPPVGVKLILIDSDWFVDSGKYIGCGEYTMDYGSPVILWTLEPDPNAAPAELSVSNVWRSGTPEAYGTYAAYVQVSGAANPMLRELLWTGDEWLMFGQKISEDVTVQFWAERPEI